MERVATTRHAAKRGSACAWKEALRVETSAVAMAKFALKNSVVNRIVRGRTAETMGAGGHVALVEQTKYATMLELASVRLR